MRFQYSHTNFFRLETDMQTHFNGRVVWDDELTLHEHYKNALFDSKKAHVRYKPGGVIAPRSLVLPLVYTHANDPQFRQKAGDLVLDRIIIGTPDDLRDRDVQLDGFPSVERLVKSLEQTFRSTITAQDPITIYSFAELKKVSK